MYRITSQAPDWRKCGAWRVLPGGDHVPTRIDNPNLFFATKREASARVRSLNS